MSKHWCNLSALERIEELLRERPGEDKARRHANVCRININDIILLALTELLEAGGNQEMERLRGMLLENGICPDCGENLIEMSAVDGEITGPIYHDCNCKEKT